MLVVDVVVVGSVVGGKVVGGGRVIVVEVVVAVVAVVVLVVVRVVVDSVVGGIVVIVVIVVVDVVVVAVVGGIVVTVVTVVLDVLDVLDVVGGGMRVQPTFASTTIAAADVSKRLPLASVMTGVPPRYVKLIRARLTFPVGPVRLDVWNAETFRLPALGVENRGAPANAPEAAPCTVPSWSCCGLNARLAL